MVFLRPRFVVPGTLGPLMDEVCLIISVPSGSRRPPAPLKHALHYRAAASHRDRHRDGRRTETAVDGGGRESEQNSQTRTKRT